MRYPIAIFLLLSSFDATSGADESSKPLVTGLKNPASVCIGPRGLVYVTEIGEPGKDGDGRVVVIEKGLSRSFATGLDDPSGMAYYRDALWIVDKTKIIQVDDKGKSTLFAGPEAFPIKPRFLQDITIDGPSGIALISDSGHPKSGGGAVFRLDIRLTKIETVADGDSIPELHCPHGVVFDGEWNALIADAGRNRIYRVNLADRTFAKVADDLQGVEGLIWDYFGRLYITSGNTGQLFAIPRPGQTPIRLGQNLKSAVDGCLDNEGRKLLIVDRQMGTLNQCDLTIPGWEIDESPMPAVPMLAFSKLKWTGWDNGADSGIVTPLRPVLLTHAGDGTNRLFVGIQQGTIHVFENDDDARQTKVFLDISQRVRYSDRNNEEGLLGLAFHPQYKQNGQFFVYYTDSRVENANVLSRFQVQPNNPAAVIVDSEEELLRFEKPDRNHNGGTILFGKDGYLYVTHGDGGGGGDPRENGQNLQSLLGKILRIDVDKKAAGKKYGIPVDNPFVKQPGAAPEIWAYGFRNIWRMSLDRATGQIWAADVGQGLYEEINLVQAGGNYGWNVREGLHAFSRKRVEGSPKLIDPVWEYHHELGRSITGGLVYRGKEIPEMQGAYLYADHITNRAWALRYDPQKNRVVGNHVLERPPVGVMSFGEDQNGEVYAMGATQEGRGIYRYVKSQKR